MIDQLGVSVRMSDGVDVSVRIYRPEGDGPFPTLFAASPYRYDNDDVPETTVFFWHEVGPIHWYVGRGYAYVHLDVRGSGRSGGDYGFFDRRERRDLYEVIEWIAAQPWSNGKVGGIGQSYYCASQWCMAAERPPALACVGTYDGHVDFYRGWFYTGGIAGSFASVWWNGSVRVANRAPLNRERPREIAYDLLHDLALHPTIDDWWDERSIDADLARSDVPVYSIGCWIKRDLHLNGNVRGWQLTRGPKKLRFSAAQTLPQALGEFASVDFHEKVMAPFYDHYLKGEANDYLDRPAVEFPIGGEANRIGAAETWPPSQVRSEALHLSATPSGSVTSLNDGSLLGESATGSTSYAYPDKHWAVGPVSFRNGMPDPVARVVTFTSAPLDAPVTVAGSPELLLYISSTRTDANVIVKLAEQLPQDVAARSSGAQPQSRVVAKGWLRASHRALDPMGSIAGEPYHAHRTAEPLTPGSVYELRIGLTNLAHRFAAGSRIRLELCCADSTITDLQFTHVFSPDMIGTDTFHHDGDHPSRLILPILDGTLDV